MRIQFCGADRTVTGSCHLLQINGLTLLLDCGLYQGPRETAKELNLFLPDSAARADAVILSHGHLDHCGKLPVLIRHSYQGPIYCTPATAEVARVVLTDSAKIQDEDAQYLNRRERGPGERMIEPLYRPNDIPATLKLFQRTPYGQRVDLGRGVGFTFYDAGHILGSAYVVLDWTEAGKARTLLFTADVGRYNTPILRDPTPLPGPVDHVITESTYGDVDHAPIDQVGPQLLDAVKFCIEQRSRLIVPSFAVGRTQTILWYMQQFMKDGSIPSIPVFIDSPMGVEVSHIHSKFRENYDEDTLKRIGEGDLFGFGHVTFASSTDESRKINSVNGACVIIASSPTCEFGRVLHHLKQSIERPNDMVIFVGWTPPQTLGRRLQDGQKRVKIYDRYYEVKCQIRTLHGLSAHADRQELIRFLKPTLQPQTSAYVVHGEADTAESFAALLLQNGMGKAGVPAMESSALDGEVPVTSRAGRNVSRTTASEDGG